MNCISIYLCLLVVEVTNDEEAENEIEFHEDKNCKIYNNICSNSQ